MRALAEREVFVEQVIAHLVKAFAKKNDLEDQGEDKQFEHFATHLTVGRHHSQTFDTSDLLTGSSAGIDAIAIIVNGVLVTERETILQMAESAAHLDVLIVFVQADRSAHFDVSKLGTFAFAVRDFFSDTPQLVPTEEIAERASIVSAIYERMDRLARGTPVCRMYYLTTGKVVGDQNLEARRAIEEKETRDTGRFREVSLELLGRDEIQSLWQRANNAVSKELYFPTKVAVPDITGVQQAYIGLIAAQELLKVISDPESGEMLDSIFYDNVRDWQGLDNPVNTEMAATLNAAERERFVLMNNGVTIVSRNIVVTGNKVRIEDFQVVNGCQTSNTIYHARAALDPTVMIPVKLIATQNEDLINAVIRGTNRQTSVKDEQFFALTSVPKELERFFGSFPEERRLYYERRSRQYDRLDIERTRIVTQMVLVRAFTAMFLQEPHSTTRNTKDLLARMGSQIFGADHRLQPYYAAASAWYWLEFRFRRNKIPVAFKPARYHILLALRLAANNGPLPAMNSRAIEEYCHELIESLWDPTKNEDLFQRAYDAVASAVAERDAAGAGGMSLKRDVIRTATFTEAVMAKLGVTRRPSGSG